jgi:hypothetical protein
VATTPMARETMNAAKHDIQLLKTQDPHWKVPNIKFMNFFQLGKAASDNTQIIRVNWLHSMAHQFITQLVTQFKALTIRDILKILFAGLVVKFCKAIIYRYFFSEPEELEYHSTILQF